MPTRRVKKLPSVSKDVRIAAADMSIQEARMILKDYVNMQGVQQSTRAHVRLLKKQGTSNAALNFIANNTDYIRRYQFREILGIWGDQYPEARWAKSIRGIGPIIGAGLICHINFDKVNSSSSLAYRAGLTPDSRRMTMRAADALIVRSMDLYGDTTLTDDHIKWICTQENLDFESFHKFCRKKGKPYNWNKLLIALRWPSYDPMLKKICIMMGNDFIKHKSLYQDLYRARLKWEMDNDEAGLYKAAAAKQLKAYNFKPWKEPFKVYSTGHLPFPHLKERAKRYAEKIFLAHYYSVHHYIKSGKVPYDAYALDVLKGVRKILVPNLEEIYGERSAV